MEYHRRSVILSGREMRFAPHAADVLDSVQAAHGFTLPAAIRDWYTQEYAIDILRKYGHRDVELVELAELTPISLVTGNPALVAYGVTRALPLLVESRGDTITAALDDTDDPLMLLESDQGWQPLAHSFSAWVFATLRDWQYSAIPGGYDDWYGSDDTLRAWRDQFPSWMVGTGIEGSLTVNEQDLRGLIEFFRRRYDTLSVRGSDDDEGYECFGKDHAQVLLQVWQEGWQQRGLACFVGATTEKDLYELTAPVVRNTFLGDHLYDIGRCFTDTLFRLR